MLLGLFTTFEAECKRTLEAGYVLPAYDYVLKCSHAFNLLDARGAISVTERQGYILRVRAISKACCAAYLALVTPAEETDAADEAATPEGGDAR
jgi:glycyl-tRNA synthetase alpha chain